MFPFTEIGDISAAASTLTVVRIWCFIALDSHWLVRFIILSFFCLREIMCALLINQIRIQYKLSPGCNPEAHQRHTELGKDSHEHAKQCAATFWTRLTWLTEQKLKEAIMSLISSITGAHADRSLERDRTRLTIERQSVAMKRLTVPWSNILPIHAGCRGEHIHWCIICRRVCSFVCPENLLFFQHVNVYCLNLSWNCWFSPVASFVHFIHGRLSCASKNYSL